MKSALGIAVLAFSAFVLSRAPIDNQQWSAEILPGEHDDDVNAVAFNPNSSWLASVSDDRTVRLWRVEK